MKKVLICLVVLLLSIVVLNSVSSAGVMWKGKANKVHVKRVSLSDVANDLKVVQQDVESLKLTVNALQTRIVSNELVNRQMIAEERISTLEKKVSALSGWITLIGSITAILLVLVAVALISSLMLAGKRKIV